MTNRGFFSALFWPFVALLVFGTLLWVERTGVTSNRKYPVSGFLPDSALLNEHKRPDSECLILYNGKADAVFYSNIVYVLDSMSVGHDCYDVSTHRSYDCSKYQTVILALTDMDLLQASILSILDWVKSGGQLLLAYSPEPSTTLGAVCGKLGIVNTELDYGVQQRIRLTSPLLPGGEGREFTWSKGDRSGLIVQLNDSCKVHMVSIGENQEQVPMLWECPLDRGKIVVNNNDAFVERNSRGLIAAAYSLLKDAFAYPVINASMFFIDDFPSPIPEGHNEYIDRFYDLDVESFYMHVWFPDMLDFARRYGLRYTGVLIETYEDNVEPPFAKETAPEQFRYFGNIFLQDGHEIGLHGYNHMPLVLTSFDYKRLYGDYRKWASTQDMAASLREAIRLSAQAIPGSRLKTYVPPSNVLSDEGRQMLHRELPQINTISSVYLPDDLAYEQEFDVGEDGIINLPRIIAGCRLTDYDKWTALSELSFHYVNSHFLHPDDVLDPDRGAKLGWEKLRSNLDEYLQWLYGSAGGLRSLTAQQGAMAVQRYCNLTVHRKLAGGRYVIDLDGFYDEAWLLVRVNKGTPGLIKGGSLQTVCGSLYLLHATADHIEIEVRGGE